RLWDLDSGRELAAFPGETTNLAFRRSKEGTELLTSGVRGLFRWRLQTGPFAGLAPGRQVANCAGPPVRLSTFPYLAVTPDRRTLIALNDGAFLQILEQEAGSRSRASATGREDAPARERQVPIAHPALSDYNALSPDGRLLATWGWHSPHVKIWE